MKNEITAVAAMVANNVLAAASGADIRDEVSAWVTLIGSIAITVTTIGIDFNSSSFTWTYTVEEL